LNTLTNIGCALLIVLPVFASAAEMPRELKWPDFRGGIYQSGDLYIAGQPLSEAALQGLQSAEVTTIVNLRTTPEVENKKSTPIAEEVLSKALGMTYHHLPSGGKDHPYATETVAAFADILRNTSGKVLLHCNSGIRAAHLWVAYLVTHQGMDIEDAVRLGRAANFSRVPLEGYLSKPTTYRFTTSK